MKKSFVVLCSAMMIFSLPHAFAAESTTKKAPAKKLVEAGAPSSEQAAAQAPAGTPSQKTAVDPSQINQFVIDNGKGATANGLIPGASPTPSASPEPSQTQPQQMPPMISFPSGSLGGGGGGGGSGSMGETSSTNSTSYPSSLTALPPPSPRGIVGTCKSAPPLTALKKARDYYQANRNLIEKGNFTRNGVSGRKIVINDYTQNPAQMFVFDTTSMDKDGNPKCIMSWPVDWGSGAGGALVPGCGSESHLTPPGFHITTENAGGSKYPYPSGMGMVSCEGQGSFGRGIKVHAGPGRGQGRGRTWGCPAISDSNYEKFLSEVRGGSLVYNYFGEQKEKNAPGCSRSIGSMNNLRCSPETGAGNAPNTRSQPQGTAQ